METTLIRQKNSLTSSRYELSLMEKRALYFIFKEVRKKYVLSNNGDRNLFNDLVIRTNPSNFLKETKSEESKRELKNALTSLSSRNFTYENKEEDIWLTVGFVNYAEWKNGSIEIEVSRKILPFFVELTSQYTEYSLTVAMSLKSKWSQRFYELCSQYKNMGKIPEIDISELKEMFKVGNKYIRYASFKEYVLEISRKEIKSLYDKGECDLYFEYEEIKDGRSIKSLKFQIFKKENDQSNIKFEDYVHIVRNELNSIFGTHKMQKNKVFVTIVMEHLTLHANKLEEFYKKIQFTKEKLPNHEWPMYLRAVIKNEYEIVTPF